MKKFAMLMLCLVLVFALAACAGTDTTPQGSVSDTVTVTDMKGEVAIPANPQRIVDVAGLTEELLILDMKVIASANTSMFDGVSVPKHLTTLFAERGIEVVGNYSGSSSTGDLNLEKIAELKPDLIIMNIRHEKVYEQLAAIAPTVMIDDDISYVNWRGRFKQLGQWFDKEAAVEKWLADYDAKAAELAARIRDMIGDETFAVLEANSVHFGSYYIYRSGGPGELVYLRFSEKVSVAIPADLWYVFVLQGDERMKYELLKALYDCFYTPPELTPPKQEVEECHQALIEVLGKTERRLVLQIIDAKDRIAEDTSLDSFISGFELAWQLSAELNHYENERPVLCQTAEKSGARFAYKKEEET